MDAHGEIHLQNFLQITDIIKFTHMQDASPHSQNLRLSQS